MATVKNTGQQPRGFWDDQGNHVIVAPGEEKEFNMTEEDFKKNEEILEADETEPPIFELSGGAGGVAAPKKKERERVKPQPQGRGKQAEDE